MADYDIAAVTRRAVYTGSAGTGPYAFSFACLATSDIAVYKDTTLLTETSEKLKSTCYRRYIRND